MLPCKTGKYNKENAYNNKKDVLKNKNNETKVTTKRKVTVLLQAHVQVEVVKWSRSIKYW